MCSIHSSAEANNSLIRLLVFIWFIVQSIIDSGQYPLIQVFKDKMYLEKGLIKKRLYNNNFKQGRCFASSVEFITEILL